MTDNKSGAVRTRILAFHTGAGSYKRETLQKISDHFKVLANRVRTFPQRDSSAGEVPFQDLAILISKLEEAQYINAGWSSARDFSGQITTEASVCSCCIAGSTETCNGSSVSNMTNLYKPSLVVAQLYAMKFSPQGLTIPSMCSGDNFWHHLQQTDEVTKFGSTQYRISAAGLQDQTVWQGSPVLGDHPHYKDIQRSERKWKKYLRRYQSVPEILKDRAHLQDDDDGAQKPSTSTSAKVINRRKRISTDPENVEDGPPRKSARPKNRSVKPQGELTSLTASEDDLGSMDTCGGLQLDTDGHIHVMCSSGGMPMRVPGRIGSAAILGAGVWATCDHNRDWAIGVTCSGHGEVISDHHLARKICEDFALIQTSASQNIKAMTAKLQEIASARVLAAGRDTRIWKATSSCGLHKLGALIMYRFQNECGVHAITTRPTEMPCGVSETLPVVVRKDGNEDLTNTLVWLGRFDAEVSSDPAAE
eukprot:Clim_evm132s210 gene=Clim_evmTU132s210